jgi:hypothetical protein
VKRPGPAKVRAVYFVDWAEDWGRISDGVMYRTASKMRGFFPFGKLRVRMTISFCIASTVKML